ncbi:MAG: L-aspartate oxidase [Frankiaceae bacterium]|nr:L-aspartate oxidase [Frankiaceae bacterium]
MRDAYEVIVVGSGVAGLSVALGLAGRRRVALVTSGEFAGGSTRWAQGGLAAAIGADDRPALHAEDTVIAGVGACDHDAVAVLTDGAAPGLVGLLDLGADFDRDAEGHLALTREGGHHRRRVVHAGGDATGAEVSRVLAAAVRDAPIDVITADVTDLLLSSSTYRPQVTGVIADGVELTARAVVLATGGVGGLYPVTTNPAEVAGEGLGLALRAGASLVDVEFVQFHPTALAVDGIAGQIPLVTEALRGEGAVLIDGGGARIMADVHPLADLAPRDVVARRIDQVRATGDRVFLDATRITDLCDRFPTVIAACGRYGVDPIVSPIPVAPAQHYLCGGIRTDLWGATDVAGLYAVGEVAATGVHGANRLASNSLIEGAVFARRLADRLASALPQRRAAGDAVAAPSAAAGDVAAIQRAMASGAGIRRSAQQLAVSRRAITALPSSDRALAADAILAAAAAREESRGCHWREDFPTTDATFQRHVVVRLGADGRCEAAVAGDLERTA